MVRKTDSWEAEDPGVDVYHAGGAREDEIREPLNLATTWRRG